MSSVRPTSVSLNGLLAECDLPPVTQNSVISQIVYHSDHVSTGSLFCCLPGKQHDGHDFATQAESKGAAAVLCERPLGLDIPQIQVPSARAAMAQLASAFYGHPSKAIPVIGITGTNGKTSVVSMLAEIYRAAGQNVETVGTLTGSLTTPEAPELQSLLARACSTASAMVMEVSSHAIAQHRIDAIDFELCGFTNLSPEHLDYHQTMEEYFAVKKSLFSAEHTRQAVICIDDAYGQQLYDWLSSKLKAVRCATADVTVFTQTLAGSLMSIEGVPIQLPLAGWSAIANANIAFVIARELGFDSQTIKAGLEQMPPIAGRFEIVVKAPVAIVVDYAHTPQALEQALLSCRKLAPDKKCHVVFGCGGERDPSKRPEMGRLAGQLADFVYLTNDNPRQENPEQIISEIVSGIESLRATNSKTDGHTSAGKNCAAPFSAAPFSVAPYFVELDRRLAIRQALEQADFGDVVLIAGKGHEQTQTIGASTVPFDDRTVARELAKAVFSTDLSPNQSVSQA